MIASGFVWMDSFRLGLAPFGVSYIDGDGYGHGQYAWPNGYGAGSCEPEEED